ncbi:MAG: hypothetical protein HZB51_07030 [Chloroflexi bacterium]|nr:hypothetical protein [Chloroflexota bacterium]
MTDDRCPDCGARVESGREGCQALMDQMRAQSFSDLRYASVIDLAFDAYCMQHVDKYCRSAKSYAAHLTRLCCGIEYAGDPNVYAAIQKWLNGKVALEKPSLLTNLGSMTIADVQDAATIEEHIKRVRAWAENVWAAYAVQHEIARAWVKAALE